MSIAPLTGLLVAWLYAASNLRPTIDLPSLTARSLPAPNSTHHIHSHATPITLKDGEPLCSHGAAAGPARPADGAARGRRGQCQAGGPDALPQRPERRYGPPPPDNRVRLLAHGHAAPLLGAYAAGGGAGEGRGASEAAHARGGRRAGGGAAVRADGGGQGGAARHPGGAHRLSQAHDAADPGAQCAGECRVRFCA